MRWLALSDKMLSPGAGFIYALSLTALAFILRSEIVLLAMVIPNFLLSLYYGRKKVAWVYILILISAPGIFLNALFFSNYGTLYTTILGRPIYSNCISSFLIVFLRIAVIGSVGAFFVSYYTPMEIVKGLEKELHFPKGIAFSVAYAFRLMPLISKDFGEIRKVRKQRGYRAFPLTAGEFMTYAAPLLRISYERAFWTGVAMELRGFRLRGKRRISSREEARFEK
jgi:energy-coupling factor transport system permease protein